MDNILQGQGITTKPRSALSRLVVIIAVALALAVLLGAGAYLLGRSLRPRDLYVTELVPPVPATDFTFTSSRSGGPASLSDFRGKIVLLYFGYTTCPDACPTTLADFSQVYEMLGDKTGHLQFLWLSVDPERDTPEKMEDYISHFNPEFMGLVPTSVEELERVAAAYHIYYERIDYGSEVGYLMDHTTSVTLIDEQGVWRGIYSFDAPPEEIAADLEYLVGQIK